MSWVDELLKRIDYKTFYPDGKNIGSNERNVKCIFHDDKIESCSVNLTTGQFYCHACSEKGNVFTWAKKIGKDIKDLAADYKVVISDNIVNKKIVDAAHNNLLKNEKAMIFLKDKRGINKDTIEKFKLGLLNDRLSIPIKGFNGKYVNVRLYKSKSKTTDKVISYGAGFGEARLFPCENLYAKDILICEGEMDCLLACQLGFNAVTPTTGAGTWKKEWNHLFDGKNVTICFDIDMPGKKGAKNVSNNLQDYASEIKIINLPINAAEIPNGDFTDYIINLGNTANDFKQLVDKTNPIEIKNGDSKKEYDEVNLANASKAKYSEKNIKFNALISGKDVQPYIVPKKVKLSCHMNAGKVCDMCNMAYINGELEYDIDNLAPDFLLFMDNDNFEKKRLIKAAVHIPNRCHAVNIEILDNYNIERIIVTPEIEFTTNITEDENYVLRTVYYLGHNIETNRVFDFKGITLSHPKTQQATHLLTQATPALTSIESFNLDSEKLANLKKFSKADYDAIYENSILPQTGIKGRLDLFIVIFLSYCSPLHFKFDNRMVKKGWVETLILGDTRTGKTEMAKSLIEYFKIGELVLGESASFAGLIGGLQQIGNRWHLNWGRIPLNNKRLVFVDEMSGLATWDIGKLSGIRSSGIAEITKIRTERTYAKTRVIWMSNVRGNNSEQKDLMAYTQGIRAVPELIGKQEDISRFDLVLLLSQAEVSADEINKPIDNTKKRKFSGEDFHDLIMWCWKLEADNIQIQQDASDLIFEESKKLGDKYSQGIPIIVPSEQRIKLAKIAVAVAASKFSTEDGKELIVKKEHVQYASNFLQQILDKPVAAYDEFSRLEKSRLELKNAEDMKLMFSESMIDQLLDMDKFLFGDLQDILGIDLRSEARKTVTNLINNNALKRVGGGYEKTEAFIKFIRNMKLDGKIPKKKKIIEEDDNIEWPWEKEK